MLLEHTSYVEVLRETVPPEDIPGSVSLAKESVLRVARVGEVNSMRLMWARGEAFFFGL